MTLLLDGTTRWQCPSCDATHVTPRPLPPNAAPMHPCKGLRGIVAPFAPVSGSELRKHSIRHRVIERDDYIGRELVRTDTEGRPVMAVITDRADGSNDCTVFPGTAQGHHD